LQGSHSETQRAVGLSEVSSVLANLVTPSKENPEVLVAFVAPQLSSAMASYFAGGYANSQSHAALSSLKTSFESATTSFSIPALYPESGSVSATISTVFVDQAAIQGSQTLHGATSKCDNLMTLLNGANIFTNSASDLVLVSFDSSDMSVNDACLNRVLQYVASASTQNFAAVFSADSAPAVQMSFSSSEVRPTSFVEVKAMADPIVGVLYVTGPIVFGLLFGLLFLFTTLVAVCCMNSIQTPLRFPSRKLAVGKEF